MSASVDILNRMLVLEYWSFPRYLATSSSPWRRSDDRRAADVLSDVATEQERLAVRLSERVVELGGTPATGVYPIGYADRHFLSLEYLISELVDQQRQALAEIDACVSALGMDAGARALAQEVRGAERAHLEQFQELARRQPA